MVKFHNKIAMPFASLIIILIGVPLSAKKNAEGSPLKSPSHCSRGFSISHCRKPLRSQGIKDLYTLCSPHGCRICSSSTSAI
jgi:lipopolysaccharide export system permease protein